MITDKTETEKSMTILDEVAKSKKKNSENLVILEDPSADFITQRNEQTYLI